MTSREFPDCGGEIGPVSSTQGKTSPRLSQLAAGREIEDGDDRPAYPHQHGHTPLEATMRSGFRALRPLSRRSAQRPSTRHLVLEELEPRTLLATTFLQTNLVT